MRNNIINNLSDLNYLPRWGVLILDTFLCVSAYCLSLIIGSSLFEYWWGTLSLAIWQQGLIICLTQVVFFLLFNTYSGIIRYSTIVDLWKVFGSVFSNAAVLIIINILTNRYTPIHLFLNTPIIIYAFVAFTLLFCMRLGIRTIYDSLIESTVNRKRVLIYGTQSVALSISKMLRSSGYNKEYNLMGFITDGKDVGKHSLQGMNVYYKDEELIETMKRLRIENIIVSPIKMQEIHPATDLDMFLNNGIKILTIPSIKEWSKADKANKGRIETIPIEALLERDPISIDTANVRETLHGKTILVTGAAGSIGSEITRQALSFNPTRIILYEQAESPLHDLRLELEKTFKEEHVVSIIGDIRNRKHVEYVFSEYKPDIVFHAAAYKHVPLMEEYPNEAIQANVSGTKNIADMSVKYGAERFVMISTDKAVNPTNVMGASKRIAEIYVQSLNNELNKKSSQHTKFITTRFGNVLGSNGSVIPYFKKQIAAGGPVTVTHPDIIRYFMTIPEACNLVLEAAALGNGGEIYVFDMGHPVKILDLAENMIKLAGYIPNKDIIIEFTGLRPGEKLYEEVLNQKETTLPTSNNKIMAAKVEEVEFAAASKAIEHLIKTSELNEPMDTVKEMKEIVKEYKSNNSIYEQLDKQTSKS